MSEEALQKPRIRNRSLARRLFQDLSYRLYWKRQYFLRFARFPDRQCLDQRILPAIAELVGDGDVLEVGCDWHSLHQRRVLKAARVTSIDMDQRKAKFGGDRHVVGRFEDGGSVLADSSFDVVLCNGVFGWGIDREPEIRNALEIARTLLKPGGILLLGWNAKGGRCPEVSPFEAGREILEDCAIPGLDQGGSFLANGGTGHTFGALRREGD